MADIGLLGNSAQMHDRGGSGGGAMTTSLGRESRAQVWIFFFFCFRFAFALFAYCFFCSNDKRISPNVAFGRRLRAASSLLVTTLN